MTKEEFIEKVAANPMLVRKLYTDGGLAPGTGGSWAWCAVGEDDEMIFGESGFFAAPPNREITSPQAEFAALTKALEAMPDGWAGIVASDHELTLSRFFKGHACFNIPPNMLQRAKTSIDRMGRMTCLLLQHKPTKKDLENGFGKKTGLPVSRWNVWCDKKCDEEKRLFLKSLEKEKGAQKDEN